VRRIRPPETGLRRRLRPGPREPEGRRRQLSAEDLLGFFPGQTRRTDAKSVIAWARRASTRDFNEELRNFFAEKPSTGSPAPTRRASAILRGDGNIAGVEQAVDVGTKQEAVADVMLGTLAEAADVRGVESRERPLAGHGALAS
jgi:hypothetical protein